MINNISMGENQIPIVFVFGQKRHIFCSKAGPSSVYILHDYYFGRRGVSI